MENITMVIYFHRNIIKKNGLSKVIDRNFIYRKNRLKTGLSWQKSLKRLFHAKGK